MNTKTQLNHTVSSILVPTALPNTVNDFLVDRELRGVRPATLLYYKEEIYIFLKWAAETGARTLEDITSDLLRAYFLNLGKRRNATAVHTNYGAIKTLLLWAWGEFELPGSCPIAKVKVANPEAEPKPGVSLEDISRLLEVCNGERDRAILLFLLDTGIRRRELCALNFSDLTDDTVHLSRDGTKAGKARAAFISLHTRKAMRAYFRERGEFKPDEPLFTAKGGGRLTVSGLRQIIRRLCKTADIPEVGLHDFRRTFALESLRAGADVVSVSRLLGHASIEVTKRYLAQVEEDLKAAHAKASPVDTLLRKKR